MKKKRRGRFTPKFWQVCGVNVCARERGCRIGNHWSLAGISNIASIVTMTVCIYHVVARRRTIVCHTHTHTAHYRNISYFIYVYICTINIFLSLLNFVDANNIFSVEIGLFFSLYYVFKALRDPLICAPVTAKSTLILRMRATHCTMGYTYYIMWNRQVSRRIICNRVRARSPPRDYVNARAL